MTSQSNPSSTRSEHECIILIQVTLNPSETITNTLLPTNSLRTIIPLDESVLFPASIQCFTVCCFFHANSIQVPFFPGDFELASQSADDHYPQLLLHSAHALTFRQLERPSHYSRIAILHPSNTGPLQFTYNDILCPCCEHHSSYFNVLNRSTFGPYLNELEDNPLPQVKIVHALDRPPHVTNTLPTRNQSSRNQSVQLANPVHASPSTIVLAHETTFSAARPQQSPAVPVPQSEIPPTDNADSIQPASVATSPRNIISTSAPRSFRTQYATTVQNAPNPSIVSSPSTSIPPTPTNPQNTTTSQVPQSVPSSLQQTRSNPVLSADTSPLNDYVLDPNREIFIPNFSEAITILRQQLIVALSLVNVSDPFLVATTQFRKLIRTDLRSTPTLRVTLANYSIDISLLVIHIQDHHAYAILSSTSSLEESVLNDNPKCGIQRCLFHYRPGNNANATIYRPSFSPIHSYHMILSWLNETEHSNVPRTQTTVNRSDPTRPVFLLPQSEFEVFFSTFNPSELSQPPANPAATRAQGHTLSESSSGTRRYARPTRGHRR